MTMWAALVVLSFSALSSASDQIYSNDSLSLTVSSATKSLSVRLDSTVKLQFILMNNGEEGRFIVSQQSRFGLTGTLSLNSLYLATGRQVTLAVTDIHVGGREGDRKDFGIRVEREHRGRNRESPPNNWNNGGRPDGNNGGFNNGGNNGGRPDWNNGGNNGGRPDWNNGGNNGNNGGFNDGDNGGRPDWNNGGNNGGRPDWNNGGNNGNNGGFHDGDNGGRPDWNNGGNNGGRPDWNNGGNNGNNGGFNDGDNEGRPDWNNGGHNGGRPDWNNGGNNGNNGGFNDGDNGGRPDWNNGGNNGGRPDWNNGGNNGGRPDWNNGGNNGNNGGFNDGGNGGRPDWDNGGHNGNNGGRPDGNNGGNGGRPDGNNGGNGWNDGRPDYRPGHRSSIEKMVEFHLSEHHERDYDEPVAAAGYVENAECEEEDSCRSKYWTAPFSAEDPGSGLWSVKFDGGDVVFWHDPIMVGSTRAVTGRFRVNCCTEEVEMKVKDVAGMTLRSSVSRGGNGGESLDTVMIFVIIGAGILVLTILLIGGVCLWKKKYSSVSQNDA